MDLVNSVLEQVKKSGTETIRVLFADQHGILRGKTIVASALASVFSNGMNVPSSLLLKDTSNRTVFPVWSAADSPMSGVGDVTLFPDPSTFRILPWSPHSAWILCDTRMRNGDPIPFVSRDLLKSAVSKLEAQGLKMLVGLEVEFHIFEILDPGPDHKTTAMPGTAPLTRNLSQGYQFLSETRYGEVETVLDDLRRVCQQMGLPIRTTEIEMGPSQFEFTFDPDAPLIHADNMVMLRTLVKEVCARRGLHATFMCRPRVKDGAASGWHLHQSVLNAQTGENMMIPRKDGGLSKTASGWIAGLLAHAAESCILTTPTVNGYKRYRPGQLAPDRIQWGYDNRGSMIRAVMAFGDIASRVENRVAETAANPYYFFASQIISGLAGITQKLAAPPAVETPYETDAIKLPTDLLEAIQSFEKSHLYRNELGDTFVNYLSKIKRAEWERYLAHISEWEQAEYFDIF
tara:strand:- start:218 stop:1597 length:1380 start_codon:yes stop_codon:yes gene_type:complete